MQCSELGIGGEKSRGATEGREPLFYFSFHRAKWGREHKRQREWCEGFTQYAVVRGRTHGKRSLSFLEFLEEGVLPLQGQNAHPVTLSSCSTAGDRGLCVGQITWPQLVAVLHHRLQPPRAQPCDCFSGTERCQAQCGKALLWGRRAGSCLAEPFKIRSFESQPPARVKNKGELWCWACQWPQERQIRAEIWWKTGTQKRRLLALLGWPAE